MKKYPSREGVPVHPDELNLAPSRLDPDSGYNYNNHHLYFNKSSYLGDSIFTDLRNLESSQVRMLKDQHNMGKYALHTLYLPPERPTLEQAMDTLEMAYATGEKLKTWNQNLNLYTTRTYTAERWKRALKEYNRRNRLRGD